MGEMTGGAGGSEAAILQAVGAAAERFLSATDWRAAVPDVLRDLGVATQTSRADFYTVRFDADGEVLCSLINEWVSEGIAPQIDDPGEQDFRMKEGGYGRWVTVLGSGAFLQGKRSDVPEGERAFMDEEGILSVLAVPIFVEGRWWGWLAFDEIRSERVWTQAETDALRAAAGVFGAAVQRERSERHRLNAEARYRALVEQLPSITYIASAEADNATLYISPQVQDLLGYTPADWIKTRGLWMKALHPDDAERVLRVGEQHQESGEPISMEYRMRSRWGKELWIHEEASLVRDDAGEPLYWQGVMIDVTDTKAASLTAAKAESRYHTLVEQLPSITYTGALADNGATIFISPQVERILGFTPDEWLADPELWGRSLHPDEADRLLARSHETGVTGEPFVEEYRFRTKDGRWVWLHEEAVLVRDEAGEPQYWQGVLLDITAQRASEGKASEAEARYQALIEHLPSITYIDGATSGDRRLDYVSPQIEQVLGHRPEEWTDDAALWPRLIHEDDRARVLAADESADAAGQPFFAEYRMRTKDGRVVWIEDYAVPIRDESGNIACWQGFMLDVTERRRLQDVEWALELERATSKGLREMDELRNSFLSALSHDVRGPLSVVYGFAMTLSRDDITLSPDEVRDLARRIATQASRVDRMVEDLLDVERFAQGAATLDRKDVDLAELVRRCVDEEEVAEHQVNLMLEEMQAIIDPTRVERIVANLLSNAVRYSPEGTTIEVSTRKTDDGALITVEDEGPGVPDELKEMIFEPYRRAHSGGPGVGVGLSLVKRFSEAHGGRAWVEDREGGGSRFCVLLPDELP